MPFADPPTADQEARLERLAADPTFDPADLGPTWEGWGCRCEVCRAMHAPFHVCGYCRGRVKAIRAAAAATTTGGKS